MQSAANSPRQREQHAIDGARMTTGHRQPNCRACQYALQVIQPDPRDSALPVRAITPDAVNVSARRPMRWLQRQEKPQTEDRGSIKSPEIPTPGLVAAVSFFAGFPGLRHRVRWHRADSFEKTEHVEEPRSSNAAEAASKASTS